MARSTSRNLAFSFGALLAAAATTVAVGPDVTLHDILSTQNYGNLGGIRGYAIGSDTCNIGNQNLLWTNGGTPALAMNMYRLNDGRLTQIGMGWCKHACCAAAGSGPCGSCNNQGGNVLGAGCLDVYGAGFNGGQFGLGSRSRINPYTGTFSPLQGSGTGTAIDRRLQVPQASMVMATFPGSLFFVEGVYVGSDDAFNGNRFNNATYKRVTVNQSTFDLSLQGAKVQSPAIFAWRAHGGGANVVDPNVIINTIDIPGEGRIFVGYKVTQQPGGTWRYEYAVYNFTSDKAVGGFSVPAPMGAILTGAGFSAPLYHSGENGNYNVPWTIETTSCAASWNTSQTHGQNANGNAIRWGMMHNFYFTSSTAPVEGNATIKMFKPHTPQSITTTVLVPGGAGCRADFNHDGLVFPDDLSEYITCFFLPGCGCADHNGDGIIFPDDLSEFITEFFLAVQFGC